MLPGRGMSIREDSEQAVSADLRDGHRMKLTDMRRRRERLHRLQIWGTADELTRVAARPLEQHIEGPA
jgi:hypothetical protein